MNEWKTFEETWIWIQRFKLHICCKFQIVPKWMPRKSLTKHFFAMRNKTYKTCLFS